jgi:hypothetical protein
MPAVVGKAQTIPSPPPVVAGIAFLKPIVQPTPLFRQKKKPFQPKPERRLPENVLP